MGAGLAGLITANAAAGGLTVAVCDFNGESQDTSHDGRKMAALVTASLSTETNLVLVERAELNKALSEQALGASGMVSADAAARVGAITGAKVLVSGEIIPEKDDHMVVVANIIGTETARLFAVKVEGRMDELTDLASNLSGKIAGTISGQATNLLAATEETHTERINRLVASIQGANRPSVSVNITFFGPNGRHWPDNYADNEFGAVLLKAGFPVVDENSDRKPDIEITGDASTGWGPKRGDLYSADVAVEVKVQERQSGRILSFDRDEGKATGLGETVVGRIAHANAVDTLAERILPLLAK